MANARVTLSKALKAKNRQAQRVAHLSALITRHNRRLVGAEREFDVRALYHELQTETERLIAIKSAISAANVPVQASIFRLAELKGRVTFLRALDTGRGKDALTYMAYAGELPEYEVDLTAQDVESEVTRLEREIDELQETLDRHNATVEVEFDLAD